jgi:hypothetical protein
LDYFKNDSDALAKTDKIINNLSAEQFRSYMNEINSGRKDAYLDFIKGAKKSKIDFNQSELFESNPELANSVYSKEIKGINISSRSTEKLGRRLTNPNWYAKDLMDVEAPYKANASKIKAPQLNAEEALKYDMNLMYNLQVQKFRKNPELIDEINNAGGLEFIKNSSHIVGVKNSRWEGKGMESNFIKVLAKSYETVAKELGKFQTQEQQKQQAQELYSQQSPITSPSLTSKIEEVKKAYLDFSYQTRLDRVSMLTNMFSDKVTELLEQESPEGTYTLEELQENPDLANKLKYKANPSKRKEIIALQNLDDNNVFNLVKKDLIAFINTSEEDLKVQEFGRFKNIPLYSDLTPTETDRILPHFIQAKKREYQKVLDN